MVVSHLDVSGNFISARFDVSTYWITFVFPHGHFAVTGNRLNVASVRYTRLDVTLVWDCWKGYLHVMHCIVMSILTLCMLLIDA